MADRVHPFDSDPTASSSSHIATKPTPPADEKPVPQPGTYVISIAKDQIYRVPSPEEARRYEHLSRRRPRRNRFCCCCWSLLSILLIIVLLLGIAAAVFYLVFKPEPPKYSIEKFAIRGLNLTSSSPISPEFDVTVKSNNPNNKIGIYYTKGSAINVYHNEIKLSDGVWPEFYQPANNVTVFQTVVRGSGVELSSSESKSLLAAQNQGTVPFKLNLRVPVKFRVGSVKTWKIKVRVSCDVTVDKLTAAAKIVSKDCRYGVNLW